MKIVGVAACTAGVAHTYIAREKMIKSAETRGHIIHCETQGTIGVEYELLAKDIEEADVVILAVDIAIDGIERFKGKKVIKIGTSTLIKNPIALMQKVEKLLEKEKKSNEN
ncbi:fructose PTS transporter subunit IIB [Irregularibacter muris]|uniref:Fructose PTS transporter subunit IIB n=1 Tax=Irregularibacter muris TaxID=1796619 RepID=A0AAE3L072_9FIRM|nr:fructose PTS transporter subunit IIB [Irregularibacter muris]MCR1899402.1 fructose PTS transporter subunit IIB [Irregularibacter muris]